MLNSLFKYYIFSNLVLVLIVGAANKPAQAQEASDDLFVLKGKVLSSDSLLPIPNAHIISKFNRWGTISDSKGDFAMLVDKKDSLLITSIGFSAMILYLDDTIYKGENSYPIYMTKDTILMNEFIVHAFWDYTTFKQIIINMKPIDFDFSRLDFEENLMLALPAGQTGLSPVQGLYNRFNREERLRRQLIKNRKKYNQLMIDMGRPQDTIPATPEHMQVSPYSP